MLEKLFNSKARFEILKLLLFNKDKEFHLREISKITKLASSVVFHELQNLKSLNLITYEKKANLAICSINENNPIIQDLKNIFIKTDLIGELITQKLKEKVKFCLIYGSFAKGTETSRSDVDLLIISEMGEEDLLNIITSLEKETNREINYILWNEKTFIKKAKDNHLLKTINSDEIIMLIGKENEFRNAIK
jgi:predicted nucleotidyltransferase